jgi:hypothetical protein
MERGERLAGLEGLIALATLRGREEEAAVLLGELHQPASCGKPGRAAADYDDIELHGFAFDLFRHVSLS